MFKNYIFVIALLVAVLMQLDIGYKHYNYITHGIASSERITDFILGAFLNLIFLTILILLFRLTMLRISKKNLMKNLSMIGKRKLKFTDNNKLILITDNMTKEYDLAVIQKIVEVTAYYYLYIDKHTAIIVPKKASKSDEFIDVISEKINVC